MTQLRSEDDNLQSFADIVNSNFNQLADLIAKENTNPELQIFVLTHSSYDFDDFAYRISSDSKTRYVIYKSFNDGSEPISKIRPAKKEETHSTYYAEQFKVVCDFAFKTETISV